MDDIVSNLIGAMVLVIIAYQVVLPISANAIWGTTWNGTAWVGSTTAANLSTGNRTLSGILQTLVILLIIIYLVRVMTG